MTVVVQNLNVQANIWILARYDIVRLRTISYEAPTTSYVGRTMSYSTSYVRYRTYDVTYDIEHRNQYDVVRLSTS
jgi:hypothetical protein